MSQNGSGRKVANGLVAASAAGVLAVYAAGYERTRSAAEKLEAQSETRRPAPLTASGAVSAIAPPAPPSSKEASSLPAEDPVRTASLERAPSMMPHEEAVVPAVPAATAHAPESSSAASEPPAPAPVPSTPIAPAVSVSIAPPSAPPAVAAPAPAAKWKDGTYKGWGTCRHGDIEAEVVIEGGRIKSASISQCLTRYSCDIIGKLPPEVIQRQSAEVDYVSGATQSANAFYYAVTEALGKAK